MDQLYSFFIHPMMAFVLVVLLVMPCRKIACRLGVTDCPDARGGRKQHDTAIPPIGGLIIFSVFLIYGSVSGIVDLSQYWSLYAALIVLLVSGAIDDMFPINAKVKFVIHFAAAALIAFCGNVQAAYLGDLFGFGVVWTGAMSYPFTLIAVVLLINALNLIDGIDGLCAGSGCVILGWMAVAAILGGWYSHAAVLFLLIGCLAGFLVFNMRSPWRRRASMFIGDAGSMSLGLVLAWFAVHLARNDIAPLEPIAVAWIIGFPIFDTCAQFFRRACHGRDPFSPDRDHFHHHVLAAGFPVSVATPLILVLIAMMGAVGVGGIALGLPPFVLLVGWGMLFVFHIAMSYEPARYVRVLRRLYMLCGAPRGRKKDVNDVQ